LKNIQANSLYISGNSLCVKIVHTNFAEVSPESIFIMVLVFSLGSCCASDLAKHPKNMLALFVRIGMVLLLCSYHLLFLGRTMIRFAGLCVALFLGTTAVQAKPPILGEARQPQGKERTPIEREFYEQEVTLPVVDIGLPDGPMSRPEEPILDSSLLTEQVETWLRGLAFPMGLAEPTAWHF